MRCFALSLRALPVRWPAPVKTAFLCAISLASTALLYGRARALRHGGDASLRVRLD